MEYPLGDVIAVLMLSGEVEKPLSGALDGWSVMTVSGARGEGLRTGLRNPCEWPLINGCGRILSDRLEMEWVDGGRVTDRRLEWFPGRGSGKVWLLSVDKSDDR